MLTLPVRSPRQEPEGVPVSLGFCNLLGFWKLPELTTIIGGVRMGYAASTGISLPLASRWEPDMTLILLNRVLQMIPN